MSEKWYIVCLMHNFVIRLDEFPFYVGRESHGVGNSLAIDEPFISRLQFSLEIRKNRMWYVNRSLTNLGIVDGEYPVELELSPHEVHIVNLGDIVIGIGTDVQSVYQIVADNSPDLFKVFYQGKEIGPLLTEHLLEACAKGVFNEETTACFLRSPNEIYNVVDLLSRLKQGLEPIPCAIRSQKLKVEENVEALNVTSVSDEGATVESPVAEINDTSNRVLAPKETISKVIVSETVHPVVGIDSSDETIPVLKSMSEVPEFTEEVVSYKTDSSEPAKVSELVPMEIPVPEKVVPFADVIPFGEEPSVDKSVANVKSDDSVPDQIGQGVQTRLVAPGVVATDKMLEGKEAADPAFVPLCEPSMYSVETLFDVKPFVIEPMKDLKPFIVKPLPDLSTFIFTIEGKM